MSQRDVFFLHFHELRLAGSQQSFAGNFGGERGSLEEQWAKGVRMFHFTVFSKGDDLVIGSTKEGDQVANHLPGNPLSFTLSEWLGKLHEMGREVSGKHLPVVIFLDLKTEDMAKQIVSLKGGLSMVNWVVSSVFGNELFTPSDLETKYEGHWPQVQEMCGKFLVVLSGPLLTLERYTFDRGLFPVVASNSHGVVITMHGSKRPRSVFESGTIWYWTGSFRTPDGSDRLLIDWHMHGRVENYKGSLPAVAINDHNDGVLFWISSNKYLYYLIFSLAPASDQREEYEFVRRTAEVYMCPADYCSVALNNQGRVIVVWSRKKQLMMKTGRLDQATPTIVWNVEKKIATLVEDFHDNKRPSVHFDQLNEKSFLVQWGQNSQSNAIAAELLDQPDDHGNTWTVLNQTESYPLPPSYNSSPLYHIDPSNALFRVTVLSDDSTQRITYSTRSSAQHTANIVYSSLCFVDHSSIALAPRCSTRFLSPDFSQVQAVKQSQDQLCVRVSTDRGLSLSSSSSSLTSSSSSSSGLSSSKSSPMGIAANYFATSNPLSDEFQKFLDDNMIPREYPI